MSLQTLLLAALPALTLAAPKPSPDIPKFSSVKTLGQLPPPAFFENIAIRPSGSLLATLLADGPDIYTVTSPSSSHHAFNRLTSIPSVDGLTGIAEVLDGDGQGLDRYVVTGGNSTTQPPNDFAAGTWSAWMLTLDGDEATTVKISDLSPETALANGMAAIPNGVLVADSGRGSISRLDLATLDYEDEIIAFPEMLTTPDFELGIGINGIQIHDDHLYFSNSALASIYRFPITPAGYPNLSCSERPELVANISSIAALVDDFTIDGQGNLYVATNAANLLVYVDGKTGAFEVVAGAPGEFTVAGGSAAAFGRTAKDDGVLYVTTAPATIGNVTEGGKILAVEF